MEQAGLPLSRSAVGNPYDTAQAERVFKTLKTEEVYLHAYPSVAEAEWCVGARTPRGGACPVTGGHARRETESAPATGRGGAKLSAVSPPPDRHPPPPRGSLSPFFRRLCQMISTPQRPSNCLKLPLNACKTRQFRPLLSPRTPRFPRQNHENEFRNAPKRHFAFFSVAAAHLHAWTGFKRSVQLLGERTSSFSLKNGAGAVPT